MARANSASMVLSRESLQENMKRVPHVLVDARYHRNPRGGDRCRFELTSRLLQRQTERYSVLAYAHAAEQLKLWGANVELAPYTPAEHPQADWFEHVTLPNIARRIKADIYHATFSIFPLRRSTPIDIVTIHDMAMFAMPEAYGRYAGPFGRFRTVSAIRGADCILTVSQTTKDEIVRYLPWAAKKRIVPILNGVSPDFLDASQMERSAVDEIVRRVGLQQPYILFVGNLERKKNIQRLIEAFVQGREKYKWPHHLVIVGEKPPRLPPEISASGEVPPGVVFTGYVEDQYLPALYSGAALVAYPSIYEGFGLPVIEGMAAGTPVLTSNVSSLPEVAGGCAQLVDPFDVNAICEGLNRALHDETWRKQAVESGLERARQLSWDANAQQTADIYHQLLDERA